MAKHDANNITDHDRSSAKMPEKDLPPAGPHHKPELTDEHKTPGSGMLPDHDDQEVEGSTG